VAGLSRGFHLDVQTTNLAGFDGDLGSIRQKAGVGLATRFPVRGVASYTAPIPPAPRNRVMVHGPIAVPMARVFSASGAGGSTRVATARSRTGGRGWESNV
jgi:hypothetical protein